MWHTSPASMPSPSDIQRLVPRQFLERVSRPLLARLLAPHGDALVRHGFPLAELAASAQTDRVHVEALWRLLGAAPAELAPLRDELVAIADVATPGGHELLLARDAARVLDRDLGAEDCAATAHLEHRALFDTARPQTAGQAQTKSFASFQSSSPRALPDDPTCRATFVGAMSGELESRGRTSYFKMHEWSAGSERHMELVYGRLASARDLIGKTNGGAAHDVTSQVTDRTTERAHCVFHEDTLRFDVAGYDWMKELVRRVFGESYFGSASHFEGDETITLAPLADLGAALSVDGIPGLKKAELQEVWIDLVGDGAGWVAVGARGDCMKGASAGFALRALSEGKPVEATFLLSLASRTRPIKVKIAAPRRVDFDRRDARVVQIVRDWVVARGFMSLPDHMRASQAPPADEVYASVETEVS
jgi:hypothetical protein